MKNNPKLNGANIYEWKYNILGILALLTRLFSDFFLILSNCKLNDSLVNELKKKLSLAENKLTDIRLEALTSVHQVDQLKEYVDKMKVMILFLKLNLAII